MCISIFLTTADMFAVEEKITQLRIPFSLIAANQMTVKGKKNFLALE